MDLLNSHLVVVFLVAVGLVLLLQFLGPYLLGFLIGEKYLTVNLFHVLPIIWISYSSISDAHAISFLQAMSPWSLKVRNRVVGKTVRVHMINKGLLGNLDITPDSPDEFVKKLRTHLYSSQNLN